MDQALLKAVNQQVSDRLSRGEGDPPWVWFRLMKLKEALGEVIGELDSPISQRANLPQSAQQQGKHLQLVGSSDPQGSVQHHRADKAQQKPK